MPFGRTMPIRPPGLTHCIVRWMNSSSGAIAPTSFNADDQFAGLLVAGPRPRHPVAVRGEDVWILDLDVGAERGIRHYNVDGTERDSGAGLVHTG